MKNNTIIGAVVVLVLVAGGIYMTVTKDKEVSTVDSLTEQNVAGDASQTGDTENPNQKTMTVVSAESQATYEIDEVLRGTPTHVVGTSRDITGSIVFDTTTNKVQIAEVKLDASTLKTDIAMRDGNVKKLVLKSDQSANQFITFKTTAIEGESLEVQKEFPVKVTGDLTISGVTKSIIFNGMARLGLDNSLTVKASTDLTYGDFGVAVPDLPFLANVSKTVKLTVDLVAR
jgi:polyisoprenoid-binding protein YceI